MATGAITTTTGSMSQARSHFAGARLLTGHVLVAGGTAGTVAALASAELYKPEYGSWYATGAMTTARMGHTATLLQDGRVLVAGGRGTDVQPVWSAEAYNPQTGTWSFAGWLTGRYYHTAVRLNDGRVLVTGGIGYNNNVLASAELYQVCAPTNCAAQGASCVRDFTSGGDMGSFWRVGAVFLVGLTAGCGTEQRCRSHATRYETSGSDAASGETPIAVDCELDRDLLERTCTAHYEDPYGRPSVETQTVRYASLADFVDEASPVGNVRAISVHITNDGYGQASVVAPYLHANPVGDTDYIYDGQGRLINHDFDDWDQARRPVSKPPTDICTQDTGTQLTYDDTARTITINANTRTSTRPPDNSIPCIPITWQWTFDAHGNLIQRALWYSSGQTPSTVSYSVRKEEEVCVER